MTPASSRAVTRDGVRLHYTVQGPPPPAPVIVLLAGAGTDHTAWAHQANHLAARCRVIATDHRGSGRSDRPDGPYDVDLLTDDLAAIVEAEWLERFALAGYSMGGLVAQRYLGRHPDRVERLALLNCTLGAGVPDIVLPEREVTNTFLFSAALSLQDVVQSAMDFHFGPGFEAAHPAEARVYREMFERNGPGIEHQVPVLVSSEPLVADLSAIAIPVLCILARGDVVTPPANAEVIRRHIPHARVELLDGPHASMLVYPDEVNRLLDEFLQA